MNMPVYRGKNRMIKDPNKGIVLLIVCTIVTLVVAIYTISPARSKLLQKQIQTLLLSNAPITKENKLKSLQQLNLTLHNLSLPQLLDSVIHTVKLLRRTANDEPRTLTYQGVYTKSEELLKDVQQLKTDFQIAEAASKVKTDNDCVATNLNEACTLKHPVEELVSIAINLVGGSVERLPIILDAIYETYPRITTVVGVSEDYSADNITDDLTLKIKWIRLKAKPASSTWNSIAENVDTPYVLIAKNLLHFDKNAYLEKMVRFLVSTGATAVGGASRDLAGYWRAGCYQMKTGVYTLKLEEGYRRSVVGCMKCDFIDGPFLVKTEHFHLEQSHQQTEGLMGWFFQKFLNNELGLACPEIMFYQKPTVMSEIQKSTIQNFARAQKFDTFVFPGNTLEFDCSKLNFDCRTNIVKGVSLPRCCIRKHVNGLVKATKRLKDNNITYCIEAGTLLAATKIGNLVTWDTDSDLYVQEGGSRFLSTKRYWAKSNRFHVNYITTRARGKTKIRYGHNQMEFYDVENIYQTIGKLPKDLKKNFTVLNINKNWFVSFTNPGSYARQLYGEDYLKHRTYRGGGKKKIKETYNVKGFENCSSSIMHTCLDQYPDEGNLDLYP